MTASPLTRPIYPILMLVVYLVLSCIFLHGQGAGEQETRIASALRDGDNAAALQLLGPALRQLPEDAQLWTMQGVAYDRHGNKKEALASFEHALKLAPDSIPALQGAAQINFDAGSPRAIPFLQRLLRLHPDDVTSHGLLAILEFQQGNCSGALPHFQKAAAVFKSGDACMPMRSVWSKSKNWTRRQLFLSAPLS